MFGVEAPGAVAAVAASGATPDGAGDSMRDAKPNSRPNKPGGARASPLSPPFDELPGGLPDMAF